MKKLCLFTPVILLIGFISCRQQSEPSDMAEIAFVEDKELQLPSSQKSAALRDTTMAISIKVNMDTSTYYFIAWTSDVHVEDEKIAGGTGSYQLHSFSALHTRKMLER